MPVVGKRWFVATGVTLALLDQVIVTYWGRSLAAQLAQFPERWLPWQGVGSWVVALAICAALAWKNRAWALPLGVLAAGALSNLMSYLRYGSVIDFIPFLVWHTNTADLLVVIGGIWLVLQRTPTSWWRWLPKRRRRRGLFG